jgi:phosphoribosylglycinamide formyltransferase-1
VTADLDAGPIIVQGAVPVLAQDDVDSLAARVLAMEHRIYPQAIAWLVSGRLRMEQGKITIDGEQAGEFSPCIWPGTED